MFNVMDMQIVRQLQRVAQPNAGTNIGWGWIPRDTYSDEALEMLINKGFVIVDASGILVKPKVMKA